MGHARASRSLSYVLVVGLLTVALTGVLLSEPASAESISSWSATTAYPTPVGASSCAISSGFIYCVGGAIPSEYTSAVYFAPVSSSGVGTWSSTTSYPFAIYQPSCDISSDFIFCVGGYPGGPSLTSAVYFAPVSSSGVGSWSSTTSYPTLIIGNSCTISSGLIYCVGGNTATSSPSGVTSAVYFAPVSSSGVGTWSSTTSYPFPVATAPCSISSGFIYCVGGNLGTSGAIGNAVYFAPVSSSGVGSWSSTTSYPTVIFFQSCGLSSAFIYCVGGSTGQSGNPVTSAVYFAPVSSSGVGMWTSTTSYPISSSALSCDISSGFIYCLGGYTGDSGYTNAAYYTQIMAYPACPNPLPSTITFELRPNGQR